MLWWTNGHMFHCIFLIIKEIREIIIQIHSFINSGGSPLNGAPAPVGGLKVNTRQLTDLFLHH